MTDRPRFVKRVRFWLDSRPLTGWYLALFLGLNYVIDILQLL